MSVDKKEQLKAQMVNRLNNHPLRKEFMRDMADKEKQRLANAMKEPRIGQVGRFSRLNDEKVVCDHADIRPYQQKAIDKVKITKPLKGAGKSQEMALLVRDGDYNNHHNTGLYAVVGEKRNPEIDTALYQKIKDGLIIKETKRFWYSDDQRTESMVNGKSFINTCIIDGNEYEYTGISVSECFESPYRDMIYLGEGVIFSVDGVLQVGLSDGEKKMFGLVTENPCLDIPSPSLMSDERMIDLTREN